MKKIRIQAKVAPKILKEISITTEFIRLDAALKLANVVGTGGQAKMLIEDEQIKVNGELCTQRGKKLRDGDAFSFENQEFAVKKEI